MKKFFILLAVFVFFYLGAHFALRWKRSVGPVSSIASRLIDCEPNQIRSIKITQVEKDSLRELSFQRVDQILPGTPPSAQAVQADWMFVAPIKRVADPQTLMRLAAMICEIYNPEESTDFLPAESKEQRADSIIFEVNKENSTKTYHLNFGRVLSSRLNVVQLTEGDTKKTANISPLLLKFASAPMEAFTNMRVMKLNLDNIQSASVSVDGVEAFSLQREGSEWSVLKKERVLGRGSEEAGKYINRLASLRAIEVLDAAYSPQSCGSEKSSVRVLLAGVGGKRESLSFLINKKELAACSDARPAKYKIHEDFRKYIYAKPETLLRAGG